jgi:hypothetical protein
LRAEAWQKQMLENGDLAGNLLKFAGSLVSVAPGNMV